MAEVLLIIITGYVVYTLLKQKSEAEHTSVWEATKNVLPQTKKKVRKITTLIYKKYKIT